MGAEDAGYQVIVKESDQKPQLIPPIIIRMRISFFKAITPFKRYFIQKYFTYTRGVCYNVF